MSCYEIVAIVFQIKTATGNNNNNMNKTGQYKAHLYIYIHTYARTVQYSTTMQYK